MVSFISKLICRNVGKLFTLGIVTLLVYIFQFGLRVHLQPSVANPQQMLYRGEILTRQVPVLAELRVYKLQEVWLVLHRFGMSYSNRTSVQMYNFPLQPTQLPSHGVSQISEVVKE